MATKAVTTTITITNNDNVPQWKKDLIAKLRNQYSTRKNEERLWTDHRHPPSSLLNHHNNNNNHHHHHNNQTTSDLVVCASPENGFKDNVESTQSSDSEDLHYGPGIVNKLRNKYLSLALKESNNRPTILRKATSLENLLDNDDDDDDDEIDGGNEENGTNTEDTRLFRRRGGGKDALGRAHLRHFKSSNGRQEMKRARSVEIISRNSPDDVITITPNEIAKINNRKSLHEDILITNNQHEDIVDKLKSHQQKPGLFENGVANTEMSTNEKFNHRIVRPKRIPPLLNEREKPPADVVKHARMIFEKRPEQRTKRPPQTGDVAAKVDSFNNIIVKAKVAFKATKPPIKHSKPLSNNEKLKNNTNTNNHHPPHNTTNNQNHHHIRPSGKPVILNEEMTKPPKSLELKGSKKVKREVGNNLPSPIPDVSRVDFKNHDDTKNNAPTNLCETPDLIMTSSPLPKITSPSYKKRSTENFIRQEKNSAALQNVEAVNRFVSPINSPTKTFQPFHKDDLDSTTVRLISPISQNNISKHAAASAVFNFLNTNVDQKHLPTMNKNVSDSKIPCSEPLKIDVNGFSNSNGDGARSALEIEKNQKNTLKLDGAVHSEQERNSKVRNVESIDETVNLIKSNRNSSEINSSCSDPTKTTTTVNENSKNRKNVDRANGIKEIANSESSGKITKSETVIGSKNINETTSEIQQNATTKNSNVKTRNATKLHDQIDRLSVKPVHCATSPSENNRPNISDSINSDNSLSSIFSVKKSANTTTNRLRESNTAVIFNFTARKEVPDYIANDKSRSPSRPAIPKPDEPGIKFLTDLILFPNFQEALEEEELIKSLEARPPSPCDITFINDNVVIGGRSSISAQTLSKKGKLKISFIEDPDIHEYPSEGSLLNDELSPPTSPSASSNSSNQLGHTVPSLSGSSLATYTPKTREEFQLGITRPTEPPPPPSSSKPGTSTGNELFSNDIFEEIDQPILFSTGSTSDILF